MSTDIAALAINDEEDVVYARQRARRPPLYTRKRTPTGHSRVTILS